MPETADTQPQTQKPAAAALQAKLNQGMALHRQGKLADAARRRWGSSERNQTILMRCIYSKDCSSKKANTAGS